MNATLHLLATLMICTAVMRPLARARWVWRAPTTGIVLWQLIAATWVLCAVGTVLAIGLSAYDSDIPAAFALWINDLAGDDRLEPSGMNLVLPAVGMALAAVPLFAVAANWVAVVRVRRRHRELLILLAREDPTAPGALILDHPLMMAYCLPGLRPHVVLSTGALRALAPDQLAAVLAHERTHARERHDLVLLPFAALARLVPRGRLIGLAADAVALLVEMRADEHACGVHPAGSLVAALQRFRTAAATPPAGALGRGDTEVAARLGRLTQVANPLPGVLRILALLTGLALASTPVSFLFH
jgi:Zn-dependent protease with chaperone function